MKSHDLAPVGQAGKLSARAVATVTKPGRHADGGASSADITNARKLPSKS
jgi:hypothetical protein